MDDVHLGQILRDGAQLPAGPQIPEKTPQIHVIPVHRPLGAPPDGQKIKQEVPQQGRNILISIDGHWISTSCGDFVLHP